MVMGQLNNTIEGEAPSVITHEGIVQRIEEYKNAAIRRLCDHYKKDQEINLKAFFEALKLQGPDKVVLLKKLISEKVIKMNGKDSVVLMAEEYWDSKAQSIAAIQRVHGFVDGRVAHELKKDLANQGPKNGAKDDPDPKLRVGLDDDIDELSLNGSNALGSQQNKDLETEDGRFKRIEKRIGDTKKRRDNRIKEILKGYVEEEKNVFDESVAIKIAEVFKNQNRFILEYITELEELPGKTLGIDTLNKVGGLSEKEEVMLTGLKKDFPSLFVGETLSTESGTGKVLDAGVSLEEEGGALEEKIEDAKDKLTESIEDILEGEGEGASKEEESLELFAADTENLEDSLAQDGVDVEALYVEQKDRGFIFDGKVADNLPDGFREQLDKLILLYKGVENQKNIDFIENENIEERKNQERSDADLIGVEMAQILDEDLVAITDLVNIWVAKNKLTNRGETVDVVTDELRIQLLALVERSQQMHSFEKTNADPEKIKFEEREMAIYIGSKIKGGLSAEDIGELFNHLEVHSLKTYDYQGGNPPFAALRKSILTNYKEGAPLAKELRMAIGLLFEVKHKITADNVKLEQAQDAHTQSSLALGGAQDGFEEQVFGYVLGKKPHLIGRVAKNIAQFFSGKVDLELEEIYGDSGVKEAREKYHASIKDHKNTLVKKLKYESILDGKSDYLTERSRFEKPEEIKNLERIASSTVVCDALEKENQIMKNAQESYTEVPEMLKKIGKAGLEYGVPVAAAVLLGPGGIAAAASMLVGRAIRPEAVYSNGLVDGEMQKHHQEYGSSDINDLVMDQPSLSFEEILKKREFAEKVYKKTKQKLQMRKITYDTVFATVGIAIGSILVYKYQTEAAKDKPTHNQDVYTMPGFESDTATGGEGSVVLEDEVGQTQERGRRAKEASQHGGAPEAFETRQFRQGFEDPKVKLDDDGFIKSSMITNDGFAKSLEAVFVEKNFDQSSAVGRFLAKEDNVLENLGLKNSSGDFLDLQNVPKGSSWQFEKINKNPDNLSIKMVGPLPDKNLIFEAVVGQDTSGGVYINIREPDSLLYKKQSQVGSN